MNKVNVIITNELITFVKRLFGNESKALLKDNYKEISVDPKDRGLQDKLMIWEKYYNQHRVHSSLHGKTPEEKYKDLKHTIPSIQEIKNNYNSKKEPFAIQNYKHNQMLNALLNKKTIAQ